MAMVHLIHGFNVSDGGRRSVETFRPFFQRVGHVCLAHDYGWTHLFNLRRKSEVAVDSISRWIRPGDILVGHSHGALVCWELAQLDLGVSKIIVLQPSMRRDARWPEDIDVLCLYNDKDWVVNLGRIWGRFATRSQPWRNRHGWGAAGRYGFTEGQPTVTCINMAKTPAGMPWFQVEGHSTVFRRKACRQYWGDVAAMWSAGL